MRLAYCCNIFLLQYAQATRTQAAIVHFANVLCFI